jgi:hypothetical protein
MQNHVQNLELLNLVQANHLDQDPDRLTHQLVQAAQVTSQEKCLAKDKTAARTGHLVTTSPMARVRASHAIQLKTVSQEMLVQQVALMTALQGQMTQDQTQEVQTQEVQIQEHRVHTMTELLEEMILAGMLRAEMTTVHLVHTMTALHAGLMTVPLDQMIPGTIQDQTPAGVTRVKTQDLSAALMTVLLDQMIQVHLVASGQTSHASAEVLHQTVLRAGLMTALLVRTAMAASVEDQIHVLHQDRATTQVLTTAIHTAMTDKNVTVQGTTLLKALAIETQTRRPSSKTRF